MVYFFQAGVPFSSKNAKGTAFSKAFSDNINSNPYISLLKIQDTPSQVPNAPSQVTNTPPKCRRHQVRQPKTASTPTKTASTVNIDLRDAIFVKKFTHFSGVPFTDQKMWWHTKNDKYEVCPSTRSTPTHCSWSYTALLRVTVCNAFYTAIPLPAVCLFPVYLCLYFCIWSTWHIVIVCIIRVPCQQCVSPQFWKVRRSLGQISNLDPLWYSLRRLFITMHLTTLHLNYFTLNYITLDHYALDFIALDYITQDYIAPDWLQSYIRESENRLWYSLRRLLITMHATLHCYSLTTFFSWIFRQDGIWGKTHTANGCTWPCSAV